MRIAIVADPCVPVPPVRYGGTEQIINYLIRGLKESGHQPVLLASGDSKVDCELIPTTPRAIGFALSKKAIPAHDQELRRIRRKTTRILQELTDQVDIIHSHGYDLKKFQHFPNLTTMHGPIELKNIGYYLLRRNLYFVSISQSQQGAFPDLQYMGVAYNGEDPAAFPIVEQPEDYVCFMGRFDREKNPHLAIQLAVSLGLKIKVAGKRDHLSEGYFDEEIKPFLNHPLVEFLGELDATQKIELLSKAKCNLHPTGFREPFGLTVLEAAYCGTPTLAIARGSMPELIEEGRTGLLVEDFVEGYHQLQACFEMDRSYIANRARLLFNYQTMTAQYVKAYERVIEAFRVKREKERLMMDLTRYTKEELTAIWKNRPSQTVQKPKTA